jgi:predicted MFS family arabinose efflux permease
VSERRDPRRLLPCVVAALGAGLLGFNLLPLVVGALVDGAGLDAARAGQVGSLELAGMALSALVLAPRIGRFSLRGLALGAAVLAAAAHALSAQVEAFAALAALRGLAGLAEGAVVAAGNALIAASRDPDRFAARVEIVGGLAAAGLLVALPYAVVAGAHRGAYLAMAGIVCLCLPLIAAIPRRMPTARPPVSLRGAFAGRALPVLLAGFLLTSGESAIWAFLERIGVEAGVPRTGIGWLLGGATVIGLAGAGLAAWLGTRLGRRGPFAFGIVAQAVACWLVVNAETPGPYVIATLGYSLAFFFVQPYLVGTAARVDRQGRVAAAYAGVVLVGGGIGPALGGALVGWHGAPALGWQLALASVGALLAILPLAAALDREAEAA